MKKRVIARLDVKSANVIKGIQFECLRVMGKPKDMAEEYYLQGADELVYLDIVANLYQRQNLIDIVNQASECVFIPFTIGGGVRSIEDIRALLKAGADKVAINTAATKNPELIREAAKQFGRQCIVSSIEAKRKGPKKWEAYVDNGRQATGLDVVEWAKRAEELGAGEILITSVDKDGTEEGYDFELLKAVSEAVSIPVIAGGGAGKLDDFSRAIKECRVDAVSTASLLHYKKHSIQQVKEALQSTGIDVRIVEDAKKVQTNSEQVYDIVDYNKYLTKQLADEIKDSKKSTTKKQKIGKDENWDIGVVDYEINNVKSVIKAFEKIGRRAKPIQTPSEVYASKAIVIPGVGAFEIGMKHLKAKNLIGPIKEKILQGIPLLGICLGMQMLFSESEEFGMHKGLDLIKGRVVSLKGPSEANDKEYKLPHIGWNVLKTGSQWEKSLLKTTKPGSCVYFVHSFVAKPESESVIAAVTNYGGHEFCSAVKQGNVSGTQFHPEKSGKVGLNILKTFCEENNIPEVKHHYDGSEKKWK